MSPQEACKVQYSSPRDSNGDSKQILGTAPDDQEQPHGCCVDQVWQCAVQRVYTRKYHTEPPTSCVEESVQPDSHDSSRVSEGHSIGPRESWKVFAERSNEAARANKAKVAAAAKAVDHVPRKGKHVHRGGPDTGNPKKGRTAKYCKWCKAVDGPFTTHNTDECRRFNKDGSKKDRLTKPFDSSKKPAWKKPSGGNSDQMDNLTEEMTKLKKKLKKSKKHSKKCARDSSDSDSDSS
jgi:hypothetical protein